MTTESNTQIVSTQIVSGDLILPSDTTETTIDRVTISGSYTYIALSIAPEVLLRISEEAAAKALQNAEGSSLTISKVFKTMDEEGDATAGVATTYNLSVTIDTSKLQRTTKRKSGVSSSPSRPIEILNQF